MFFILLGANAPVKFAVEKNSLYVIDDKGKERSLDIIKRVLKESTTKTAGSDSKP